MPPHRGRGSAENPPNRFERIEYAPEPDAAEDERPSPRTQFFLDSTRSALAKNDSPDIPFTYSLNPYRGCEHGCIYCYARPTHEYLGLSAGLDFETRIFVKEKAPELLRRELSCERWQPQTISISGVTDPYQPIERRTELTRRCLAVLAEFRNPAAIVTKNRLVARDADILSSLASHEAAAVFLSVTTLDAELARVMEPRASAPALRLKAIEALAKAGVPVGVMVAPIIIGLNDHEMPSILAAAAASGARFAGYVPVRLPYGVAELFEKWLQRHEPAKKKKILNQIRAMRGGRLNDPRFGSRMEGQGIFADHLAALFSTACRKHGYSERGPMLSADAFRRPTDQLSLF